MTSGYFCTVYVWIVSIHTPTQGVTFAIQTIENSDSFNPHTHAGCDLNMVIAFQPFYVSIHTPTQGVTYHGPNGMQTGSVSIHTPTQGVTKYKICLRNMILFQSTHPRRVWLDQYIITNLGMSFNPHTHAGCDNTEYNLKLIYYGFNPHTHAGCDLRQSRHLQQ